MGHGRAYMKGPCEAAADHEPRVSYFRVPCFCGFWFPSCSLASPLSYSEGCAHQCLTRRGRERFKLDPSLQSDSAPAGTNGGTEAHLVEEADAGFASYGCKHSEQQWQHVVCLALMSWDRG